METNYAPNSNKVRTEEKKAQKAVAVAPQGSVVIKKKSKTTKFLGNFFSEDAPKVASYIFNDILVPAFKKLISDIVTNGTDILLYGSSGRRASVNGRPTERYSYASYYNNRISEPSVYVNKRSNVGFDDEIIIPDTYVGPDGKTYRNTIEDAKDKLGQLQYYVDKYGQASVADLYEICGHTGHFTDGNYGWTDLRGADVRRVRDGWLLVLPRPVQIENN